MKEDFLVVYDYGTGGIWTVMRARSAEEIIQKYPVLKVVEKRPPWMTENEYEKVLSRATDIDDPPVGWLSLALTESKGQ